MYTETGDSQTADCFNQIDEGTQEMNGGATVFVIQKDEDARQLVLEVAESIGLTAFAYEKADDFMARCNGVCHGCLVTDVSESGAQFSEFLGEMTRCQIALPVIVVAGHPRTSLTVQLMRRGALAVLESPIDPDEIHDEIVEAIRVSECERDDRVNRQIVLGRIATLSDDERKVMHLVIDGMANKVIANRLNVSVRTVESRRHEVFAKMKVRSVAELVRTVVGNSALTPT